MEETKFFCLPAANDSHPEPMRNLEGVVNNWLKANPGVDIVSRQISCCSGINILGNPFLNCTVAIFFRRRI